MVNICLIHGSYMVIWFIMGINGGFPESWDNEIVVKNGNIGVSESWGYP